MILSLNLIYPTTDNNHFILLAKSFIKGKTYFLEMPGSWDDAIFFNGHYFWPSGPFPILILTPFIFIFSKVHLNFYSWYLHLPFAIGVFYLVFKTSKKLKYKTNDSLFLAYAFCFSSVFLGVLVFPTSWMNAQVMGIFLLFLSIFEYLQKRRLWLIGVYMGTILLTRQTASTAIVFFILSLIFLDKGALQAKLKGLFYLFTPFIVSVVVLGYYDYIRFGNVFEQGYGISNLAPALQKATEYGVFSIRHIPGNLYYLFISTPLPVFKDNLSHVLAFPFLKADPWGMSIFVTSPYFIYLFFLRYKDTLSKILLTTIFLTSVPIFSFYGIGVKQFGYRYSLDFLPLLFFLFIRNYRTLHGSLSRGLKGVILVSSLVNLYLLATLYMKF